MVKFNDIDKVSLQVKEKLVVGRNYLEGELFASFFMEAFLHVAMGPFAELFSDSELSLEVFRILGFVFLFGLRVIELL